MSERDEKRLSVEMSSFWFGPTHSGKVALTSCALAMAGALPTPCLGHDLARRALRSNFELGRASARWTRPKDDEDMGCVSLRHRHVFVEGPEAFGLNFAFMGRLETAAREAGARMWPAQAYWANYEARLADWELWPHPEARAWVERAVLQAQRGGGDSERDSGGARRL